MGSHLLGYVLAIRVQHYIGPASHQTLQHNGSQTPAKRQVLDHPQHPRPQRQDYQSSAPQPSHNSHHERHHCFTSVQTKSASNRVSYTSPTPAERDPNLPIIPKKKTSTSRPNTPQHPTDTNRCLPPIRFLHNNFKSFLL